MQLGICRLCGSNKQLQKSHVVPGFVIRWMRKTSGTGHIRFSNNPNQRSQDGEKRYWLCLECEGILSGYETRFATDVFHPYTTGQTGSKIKYEQWLLKFCASVSWRTLEYFRDLDVYSDYPAESRNSVEEAASTWKNLILNKTSDLGLHEQHLLPLDPIESHTFPKLPANINRYLLRAINIDVVRGEKVAFTFSKLSRFVIIGFIKLDQTEPWIGTKVDLVGGVIEARDYTVPEQFGAYLMSKANETAKTQQKISDVQIRKINQAFIKNMENLPNTDAFKALDHDVKLFGSAAFDEGEEEDA